MCATNSSDAARERVRASHEWRRPAGLSFSLGPADGSRLCICGRDRSLALTSGPLLNKRKRLWVRQLRAHLEQLGVHINTHSHPGPGS